MAPSGYSGTPLAKKLGIKEGFKIRLIHQPENYFDLFTDMPKNIKLLTDKESNKDLIHYFAKKARDVEKDIIRLRREIFPNGILWISWPKKASKMETDLSDNVVRNIALANGLVDVKVCAVDEVWSGLKLVVPVKDRNSS